MRSSAHRRITAIALCCALASAATAARGATRVPRRGPTAAGPLPVTRAELVKEMNEKLQRVGRLLKQQRLGGLLLGQVRNFSWLTAGLADNHIVITSEVGAASLLVLANGSKYVIASVSEIPRLMSEDLKGLGFEPREHPWHQDRLLPIVKELAGGRPIGSDLPLGDLRLVEAEVAQLRAPLTASEVKKYRWLGRHSTEAVIEVVHKLRPGMSERQIEALTSDALMRREIRPTVLLIGVDDRLLKFRHAPPGEGRLQRYGMVNICARRWGLVIAVTRFVHFGALPAQLARRLQAAARVNAELLAASRPGATAGALLQRAAAQYAKEGFPGQEQRHHQGGAIGYAERDWTARPGGAQVLRAGEAVAWNPTVEGAKVEDTVLVTADGLEPLTETPGWPVITHRVGGRTIRSPGILVRAR